MAKCSVSPDNSVGPKHPSRGGGGGTVQTPFGLAVAGQAMTGETTSVALLWLEP
jgi:hypothetical protein